MRGFYKKHAPQSILIFTLALLLTFGMPFSTRAGDPDDVIGPTNPSELVCVVDGEIVDLDSDAVDGNDNTLDPDAEVDVEELEDECDDVGGKLEYLHQTEIEGYVYEFVPDPDNPDQWMAIPAAGVPVFAEGIGFEIFWISEKDGFFYFYKTRFGSGPILLNLRLGPDAHPINPNVLIESTGAAETWTVYLGFYRGDVGPKDIDALHTPEGYPLPKGDSSFDGDGSLPGVGGVLEQEVSLPVIALATLVVIILPAAGIVTLHKSRSKKTDL
jgi:hypothetical protein